MSKRAAENYTKFTINANMQDADTLAGMPAFEKYIKSLIAQLQGEGAKVLHTDRSFDNGMRSSSWYAPAGYSATLKGAMDEAIARYFGGTGPSISSASVKFSSHDMPIYDKNMRAALAREVQAQGGSMTTDKSGISHLFMDTSATYQRDGRDVNFARSVLNRAGYSNNVYMRNLENLADGAGGAPGISGFMRKAARSGLSADEAEKQAVYQSLAMRSARAKYSAQYAAENPNDYLVSKRRDADSRRKRSAKKKKLKSAVGAPKTAAMKVLQGIAMVAAILTLISNFVGKISEMLSGIATKVVGQRSTDRLYNFDTGTQRRWESFTGRNKQFFGESGASLLGGAADELISAFGNANTLNVGPAKDVAPILRTDVGKLFGQIQKGGDKNLLDTIGMIGQDFLDASSSGKTVEGKVAPDEAYTKNMSLLKKAFPEVAKLVQAFAAMQTQAANDPNSAAAGVVSKGFRAFLEPAGAVDEQPATSEVARTAAVQNSQSATDLSQAMKNLKDSVMTNYSGYLAQLVEFTRSILDKITFFFPAFAVNERERNATMNAQSASFLSTVTADSSPAQKNLEAIRKKYGLKSIPKTEKELKNMDDATLARLVANEGDFLAVTTNIKALESQKELVKLRAGGDKKAIPQVTAATLTQEGKLLAESVAFGIVDTRRAGAKNSAAEVYSGITNMSDAFSRAAEAFKKTPDKASLKYIISSVPPAEQEKFLQWANAYMAGLGDPLLEKGAIQNSLSNAQQGVADILNASSSSSGAASARSSSRVFAASSMSMSDINAAISSGVRSGALTGATMSLVRDNSNVSVVINQNGKETARVNVDSSGKVATQLPQGTYATVSNSAALADAYANAQSGKQPSGRK